MSARFGRVVVGLVLPLLVVLGLSPGAPATALAAAGHHDTTTLTWLGTDSCSWTDADNWNPQQTPDTGDSVILDGSSTHPDICSVPDADLDEVTIENGVSLAGAAGTTLSADNVVWTDGSIGVSLVVNMSLTMLDASGHYEVDGGSTPEPTLTNDGSTTMIAGATMNLTAGALIVNNGAWGVAPGAGPARIVSSICCSTLSTLENAGVLDGGVNGLTFSNMGYVGDPSGIVSDGVTVDYGISTLKSGTTVGGAATLSFVDNAEVNVSGTIDVNAGATLRQTTGAVVNGKSVAFTGDGSGVSSGTYEWSGGTIDASPTIDAGVNLLVDGSATKILDGTGGKSQGTLTVNTQAEQTDSGALDLDGGHAVVVNDGSWIVPGSELVHVIGSACCSPSSTWRNLGTLEIDSDATLDFNNARFDEAPAGVVTGGGTYDLGYGPQIFEAGGTVAGGTTMILDREGSLTGKGAVNLAGGSVLSLDGGASLLGKIDFAGAGDFYWSRGTIGGTVDVEKGVATHIVDLSHDASHTRSIVSAGKKAATLTVEGGAVQDSASPISVGAGISVTNAKGSTWTIDDGGMSGSVCCASPANVDNRGTLDVEAGGSGDSAVLTFLQFVNWGTFDVGAGTVTFSGVDPEQASGTTIVDGNLTAATYHLEVGTLRGAGIVTGDLSNDMGTVSPGDGVGTLTITGDFDESPDALVVADLKDAKTDQLVVGGDASLNGTLQLSLDQTGALMRTPRVLVQAGAITQKFATVTGLSTLGGTWKTKTTSTQVQLLPK